ncbi:hypothetical protein ABIA32_000866 [Streptacidiphilus sp. MAP12-20]|uniref:hypothetical protein n=1 Tax=Streptacidiphilus sp. MAP12-20 TaxID=3156299 RepID=UPI0035170589
MSNLETVRTITASTSRGGGVTVQIWEAELDEAGIGSRREIATRSASTWEELAALGAEYSVPEGHWQVDDDAMETLGPEAALDDTD